MLLCSHFIHASEYSGKVTFDNASLSEQNDSLNFSVQIEVENEALNRRAGMRIIPSLIAGDNRVEMPDIMIQGKNKSKSWDRSHKLLGTREQEEFNLPNKTISATKGDYTLLTYNFSMPYQKWMDTARMVIYQELIDYRDNRSLFSYALDNRIHLSEREPYSVSPLVNYIEPMPEKKLRQHQGQAFLDFKVGRSNIEPGYRRNPFELNKIKDALQNIENNKDVKIVGLFIEGYASPEGGFSTNERLSRERAIALKDYIMTNFKLPLEESQIKITWTPEDWLGLRELVSVSNLDIKEPIIDIIDTIDDLTQRKSRLRLIGNGSAYRIMARDMFPQLRRVEYQIDFTVRDFTVEETLQQINVNSNLVSHYELYRAAQTYSVDSNEFESLMLDIAPILYAQDPIASINAAAAMIRRGEIGSAKRYLERHAENPAAWNNLGVVYLLENDLDKARKLFEKSIATGIMEAEHNMDELLAKELDNIKEESNR